ncbi:MAG: sigma-70 family RNA polymerase sigma factor [Bacilli bacterium]|jgi:RNA polymerase sporulation-specific sigma factor|nr:sigma-70 family RNA polymerase sigma factor [Bacilli bacterium]
MARYKVDITGINTNELKVLTGDETIKLFERYRAGDEKAKEELVNGNLKLVLSILRSFNKGNYNMDDLFQVGVIGLIKAIDNFDLSYNLKLSTYAVPLILGEVKRYIRDNTSVRVSRSIKDLAYSIIGFKEEYFNKNGVEPTNEEVAKALDIEEYKISYALDALKEPMSIFEPIYNDGGDTIYLQDQIADKKDLNSDKDMLISLRRGLNQIRTREREVLVERYIVGKTQMEIAEALNISQAQVSRIEKNAILSLKRIIK